MKKLNQLIKKQLSRHMISDSAFAAEVLYQANLLLKDLFVEHSDEMKAYQFNKGTLYISAESAVLKQEIWGVQLRILEHLNKTFKNEVKKICIKHLTIT